ILGFITAVVARRGAAKTATTQRARLFFGTGICGGFTTYSTLALDITTLGGLASGETRSLAVMTAYIAATLVLGTLAAVAGMAVGQHHTASASPPGRSS
ncbi:MAG: CrcB family protein, partial [Cellulomonadaceae bacterium]|nr:CrcB family protein [Cellulomonadaceae bacterium]